VRDAQGNVLTVYEIKVGSLIDSLFTREFNIYGTERIGYLEDRDYLGRKIKGKNVNLVPVNTMKTLPTIPPFITPLPSIPSFTNILSGKGSKIVSVYYGKKRYELNDWLGNVRVVISDKKIPENTSGVTVLNYKPEVLSIRDYYAYGSEINERTFEPIKPKYRYGFNTQEKVFEINKDHYTARYWEYDSRLGRRWNVDPKAMFDISVYSINILNPIRYFDFLGDTVRIKYAENKYLNYQPGMKYDGEDEFVSTAIDILNKINQTKHGSKVLSELSRSKNYFDIVNVYPSNNKGEAIENAFSFQGNQKGGELKVGGLLNKNILEGQKIDAFAHELFHAYQQEKGEVGATVNSEVGAYLFGRAIALSLGYPTLSFGNFTSAGMLYEKSMKTLLYSNKSFNIKEYRIAIENFKAGASVNESGLYNNSLVIPNENNPVIKFFFPLIEN